MDKVLAIQNYGRSGALFLQSLLDGHRQILSLPALNGYQLPSYWEKHGHLAKEELFTKFIQDHPAYFEKTSAHDGLGIADMGPNRNEATFVDREAFEYYLSREWERDKLSRKSFITSVYIAYNKALGRVIDPKAWLLFPIHSLPQRFGKQLAEEFSTVRFIHTIRESFQNMGSICSHINKNPELNHLYLLECGIGQIFCDIAIHGNYSKVCGLAPYLPDTSDGKIMTRTIKLEDLHNHPVETLRKLCEFLEIYWDDCLLQSTFDGKLWHNLPDTIRQTGIDKATILQKHNHLLNQFDKLRIKYLSKPYDKFYGYPRQRYSIFLIFLMPILLWLPFKMEWIRKSSSYKDYFRCRMKWIFPALFKTYKRKSFIPMV